MAILLAFLSLAVLAILGLHQWMSIGFTRATRPAREFTYARYLGESALNEFECRWRANVNADGARYPWTLFHGKDVKFSGSEGEFLFDFTPDATLKLAARVANTPQPFPDGGVKVRVWVRALDRDLPAPDVPDETAGRVFASCTARVGQTEASVSRVFEYRQLVMAPPWGFDQIAFAALDWIYMRARFQTFCRQIISYLREREVLIRAVGERVSDKMSALSWGKQWAEAVARGLNGLSSESDWERLKQELDRNAEVRRAYLSGRGIDYRTDVCYRNLHDFGTPYFRALLGIGPALPQYEALLDDLKNLPVPPSGIPRFRPGRQTAEPGDELFKPWPETTLSDERDAFELYVKPNQEHAFRCSYDPPGPEAPLFAVGNGPFQASQFEFHNRKTPFEDDPSLSDCGDMFLCPPPSKTQIWRFDHDALADRFRRADFEPWAAKWQQFKKASEAFVEFYRVQIDAHTALLHLCNGPVFARRYWPARNRLSLARQRARVGYVFPRAAQYYSFVVANAVPGQAVGGAPVARLPGAVQVDEAIDLPFTTYVGRGFVVAPRITLGELRASSGPEGARLVVLGVEGVRARGGEVRASVLAPEGSLSTDAHVELTGNLVVGSIGRTDKSGADGWSTEDTASRAFQDKMAPDFTLHRDVSLEYVDSTAATLTQNAVKRDFSVVMIEPTAAVQQTACAR